MPMRQLPYITFAAIDKSHAQRPVLRRQATDLDMRVLDERQNHHVWRPVGLHKFLSQAAVLEEATHAASCARGGPVDHADLKRLIEGSRYGDDPGLVGRQR